MTRATENVVLIGMPGVGKSTVGVLLAKQIGYGFLDTDILIQTREGRSLRQLIDRLGLEGFCRLEARHILTVELGAHVIATGGSVVYDGDAMRHLRGGGRVIHLDLKLEQLRRRLDDVVGRGVVISPGKGLRELYEERQPLYLAGCDVTVDTTGLTPSRVVERIVRQL